MNSIRSMSAALLLVIAGLFGAAFTPSRADAVYYHRGYGAYQYPYYWNNGNAYNSNQFRNFNNYRYQNPNYYGSYYGANRGNMWRGYW